MRVLLVINAILDPQQEREIAARRYPRKDYYDLRDALGADILDLAALDSRRWTRLVRRLAGSVVAQALLAWTLSSHYDAVFADQETTGFALATLYKLPFFRGRRADERGAFSHGHVDTLPPPAPSGGAWRDASPQTPTKKGSVVDDGKGAGEPGSELHRFDSRTRRIGLWGRGSHAIFDSRTRRIGLWGRGSHAISRPHDARDVRMAGVWGEASPQAPPEGAGGARSETHALPEGAGGARSETHALPEGTEGEGRPRLTMIGHLLSPRGKQLLVRGLRLGETIDAIVVHSSLQQRLGERTLGLRSDQVAIVPYQTDERFWTPRPEAPAPHRICSAGLEYRDYDTMIEAVRNLPVEVTIAAASQWSTHASFGDGRALPANVTVDSFDYAGLRALYASSLFVVVPLRDVENQAGITTILEAMAMGKAVVVSHTRGQTDVVRDRRHQSRVMPDRPSQPDWTLRLGATNETARGHTGIYVPPGDPAELRKAIVYLLEHPAEARAMGANGRRVVAETMSLDLFTRRMASVIMGKRLE